MTISFKDFAIFGFLWHPLTISPHNLALLHSTLQHSYPVPLITIKTYNIVSFHFLNSTQITKYSCQGDCMQSSLESMAVHFHQNPLLHQHLQQQHRLQPTTTATLTSTTASVSVTIKAPTDQHPCLPCIVTWKALCTSSGLF